MKKKYIESVSIFDRSLSQTLTKSDLSYSVILSNREAQENHQMIENKHQTTMRISLENTPINDHEIMGHLVAVINSMYAQKLLIFHDYEQQPEEKYGFVLSIAQSLTSPTQPKNVKIFLAKFIENCRSIFAHFAKILLGPILTLLTSGALGEKLNFFITDLVTMLISWNNVYKPQDMQEKGEAGVLLNFLIKNAYNERSEIFKLNLELIKKLVESWREILEDKISFTSLVEMIETDSIDKIICGLQINAVIIANEMIPWINEEQRRRYAEAILKTFKNPSSKVYQPGAQLLGIYLNLIVKEENSQEVLARVKDKLKRLEKDRSKTDLLMELLYCIQKGHPMILDSFMSRISESIGKAVRKSKCIYLEMFLARLEILHDHELYRTLESFRIRYLLKQNEYQKLALHIINKSIDKLHSTDFMKFFEELVHLLSSSHPDAETRTIVYEIMINATEKFKDNSLERHRTMSIILKGFSDQDEQIQNRVLNFLTNNSGLPNSYAMRFQQLLTIYYDSSFEKEFLNYATQLLLEISINHPQSASNLLTVDDRNNMKYFEIPINTRSKTSQRSLPPMFIQSQQKQLLAGEGSQIIQTYDNNNEHQAFAPTLDPFTLSQTPKTFNLKQTQNSLFIGFKPQQLDRKSTFSSQMVASQENDLQRQIQKNKEKSNDASLDYLRRRIVRTTADQKSRHFAMYAIDRREFSEESRKEKINQTQQGGLPTLYRRYRYGDFPDFYFNTLAILLPLKALVKKDRTIARDIFITIFDSIIKTFEMSADKDQEKEFYVAINASIVNIIKSTKQSYSFLVSTLIEMTIKSGKFLNLQPTMLANILPVSGILFLESQLLHLNGNCEFFNTIDDEHCAKKQKVDVDYKKQQHWIKLIEYNYQLKDFEVISGIFTEKLDLKSGVKISLLKAIDFESNGKHKDAQTIYQDLLTSQAFRNQHEKDFYYNSYFNCLANLSDWETVKNEVQQQLDSYNEIWSKDVPFYQNTLLPQLMKGELRMTLNNQINHAFIAVSLFTFLISYLLSILVLFILQNVFRREKYFEFS